MANETTLTTVNDLNYAAFIEEVVKNELGATSVIAPLCRMKDLSGKGTHAWSVPKWAAVTAAAVAEATDLANTAVSTNVATITAGEGGIMATVTDKLRNGNILEEELLVGVGQLFARSIERLIDTTIAGTFAAGFSGTAIGTSAADLTEAFFQDASYTLDNANAAGRKVSVLHPIQVSDLSKAMVASTGVMHMQMTEQSLALKGNGFWGNRHGVDVYQTTLIPTANAGADRDGAMFMQNSTVGLAWVYLLNVEFQRDASLRATEVVGTADFGAGVIEDTEGIEIVTDA